MARHSKLHAILVWVLLLLLLGITVSAAYIPFGRLNPVLVVVIAGTKAILIGAYFMHLRVTHRLVWIVAVAGFVWLGIMFTLAAGDYAARGYLPKPTIWQPR